MQGPVHAAVAFLDPVFALAVVVALVVVTALVVVVAFVHLAPSTNTPPVSIRHHLAPDRTFSWPGCAGLEGS